MFLFGIQKHDGKLKVWIRLGGKLLHNWSRAYEKLSFGTFGALREFYVAPLGCQKGGTDYPLTQNLIFWRYTEWVLLNLFSWFFLYFLFRWVHPSFWMLSVPKHSLVLAVWRCGLEKRYLKPTFEALFWNGALLNIVWIGWNLSWAFINPFPRDG